MAAVFKDKRIPYGARCPNKAYLILMGLTGAGKTTTLNFLFDKKNITKTDSYASATSQILEYRVPIRLPDVGDCDLCVIDTPGFGDTRDAPLERDSRFMATFGSFLNKHDDLKSVYPTTVLLVAKFNDDRIDGDTSHFIQMLKGVDNLLSQYRLIDKEKCNLLFVFTHMMSEDDENLKIDPLPKVKLIEGLVKTFTSLPIPIEFVMAENKPEVYGLPENNGYYKLPNGQSYPLNLFRKIQFMAWKAGDEAGEEIIRQAFKDPNKLDKIKLHNTTDLLPANNLNVVRIINKLKDAGFNIESTWISKKLKEYWDVIREEERKPYVNTLQITQSIFNRFKIQNESDIPSTAEETLNLLSQLPINPPLIVVLEKLGIIAPKLPGDLIAVGCFYNIFTDTPGNNSPFDKSTSTITEVGYKAPRGVKAVSVSECLKINSAFESNMEYVQDRLKNINVDCTDVNPDYFNADTRSGCNIIPKGQDRNYYHQVDKLTAVREHRLFRVYLDKVRLTSNFKRTLEQLPKKFYERVQASQNAWSAFFTANGTHVLDSAYAGGFIEIVASRKPESQSVSPVIPDKILDLLATALNNIGVYKPIDLEGAAENEWTFSINFHGGDPNLRRQNLDTIFTPQGVDFYKRWTTSLAFYPVMLYSEIQVENISYFVQKYDEEIGKEMERAMTSLYLHGFQSRYLWEDSIRANVTAPPVVGWRTWFKSKFGFK